MNEATMTPHDRYAAFALLVFGVPLLVLPDFQIGGLEIGPNHIGMPWVLAAILLLTMDSATRPNPKLIRWGAVVLFVAGIVSPFIANFINSSLGA